MIILEPTYSSFQTVVKQRDEIELVAPQLTFL